MYTISTKTSSPHVRLGGERGQSVSHPFRIDRVKGDGHVCLVAGRANPYTESHSYRVRPHAPNQNPLLYHTRW